MLNFVYYFMYFSLLSIILEDVASFLAQRVCDPLTACAECHKVFGKAVCPGCGWTRLDSPGAASIQTVNHDHTVLTHMFNIAKSLRFKLVLDNPASHVLKPDPKNERDRIAPVLRNGLGRRPRLRLIS